MIRVPSREIVLLKGLLTGLFASDKAVPFRRSASPVRARSPSYTTAPSRLRTGPVAGVRKPLMLVETEGVRAVHDREPVVYREIAERLGRILVRHDQRPSTVMVGAGACLEIGHRIGAVSAASTSDVTSTKL